MADATSIIRIVVDSAAARQGAEETKTALQSIEHQAKSTASSLESIEASFASVTEKVVGFVAAFLTVDKAISAIRDISTQMAQLQKTASTLGVTTQFLVDFQTAAVTSGVKVDDATRAIDRFAVTMGKAGEGNKQAITLFNDMGVKILDAGGKMRPVSDVFVDAAGKLSNMNDKTRENVLVTQTMGKSAQSIIPMLGTVAEGVNAMAAASDKLGTAIPADKVQIWKDLADAADVNLLKWRAFGATNFAEPIKQAFEIISASIMAALKALNSFLGLLKDFQAWAQPITSQAAAQAAYSANIVPLQATLAKQNAEIDRVSKINTAKDLSGTIGRLRYERDDTQQRIYQYAGVVENLAIGTPGQGYGLPPPVGRADFGLPPLPPVPIPTTTGGSNPLPVGGKSAENLRNAIERLFANAQIGLDGAQAGVSAAADGPDALAQLTTHLTDLTKITDLYVKSGAQVKIVIDQQTGAITTNNDAVKKDVAALDALTEKQRVAKNLETFTLGTVTLQQQNADTSLQLSLQGKTTEEITRQLDIQKALTDEKNKGILGDKVATQARIDAINQQAELKTQIDATTKSTQLWLQPFSQALGSVTTGFQTFFDILITTGKANWETLASSFKATFLKMLGELATLALIRPIIAPIVQTIFSPGAAQQLGYGQGVGGIGGMASIFGGGAGIASAAGGGSTGWLGGIGGWLNSPIVPPVAGEANALGGLGGAGLGGLTPLGAFGGIASIGMGAYSLLSGNGSTGSLLSGGAGILGGALSLAGPMLGLGAAAGPIGLGIGLLGTLLGGLFGGGGGGPPPMPPLQYGSGSFSFDASGRVVSSADAMNGGAALGTQAASIGQSVLDLITRSGGTAVAGRLYGGNIASGVDNQYGKPQAYTQADFFSPSGVDTRISYDNYGVSVQQTAEQLIAAVFRQDVLNGGVAGGSSSLSTIFQNYTPGNLKDTQAAVDFSKQYDQLGHAANTYKDALDKLNQTFQTMTDSATQYGLSLQPIADEQAKQTKRTAQDFIDNMIDPLAVQLRALQDQKDSALASAQYIRDNIAGVYVDINRITASFAQRQTQLIDQYYSGAITNLQNLIQQATFGTLSGASPASTLAGQQSLYETTLSRAQAGDLTSITSLASTASGYLQAGQTFYGNSPAYQELLAKVREALAAEAATLQAGGPAAAGTTGGPAATSDAVNSVLQSNAGVVSQVAALAQQVRDLVAQNAALTAQMQRIALS